MVGNSGKAMQDAVPPARTTKEVTLFVEESEGHTSFYGLLVHVDSAFAEPKMRGFVIAITCSYKLMI